MREYRVWVEGQPPPGGPGGSLRRIIARVKAAWFGLLRRPVRLVLGGLVVFVLVVGTPHIDWDYVCRHPKKVGETCRYYDWCAY
jgi:hypothetical protein